LESDIYELIRERELQLVDPVCRKNRKLLESLLADAFEEFGSSGRVYRKADVLARFALESGTRYTLSDFRFVDLAPDCILVKYRSVHSGTHAHRSSIWKNIGGNWQMLHHQSTVVPDAV